jgi:hypothetical protein
VELDRERREIKIPAEVMLDLGATAKALAADRAAIRIAAALDCGVLVNLGGDIRVAGQPPDHGWLVGIVDNRGFDGTEGPTSVGPPPRDASSLPLSPPRHDSVVTIRDGGLATSSTKVRAWSRGSARLHHIHDARRPASSGDDPVCEAGIVVAERAAFWRPLAEDTERQMTVDVAAEQIRVQVSREDLAICADILLENVFAHTPDGVGCAIRLSHREPGGAWLVVADEGPGFPPSDPTERGRSSIGSTGLGLNIARRIAESSGGTLMIGRSASGGGVVTVELGPPSGAAERRHSGEKACLDLRPEGGAPWHAGARA